ncbi:MAG: flagellin lysine-N-methylase [Lachnospiraceae bacterium]
MEYTVPDYYEKFECIASECTDTCCAGWEIDIDDESLEKYRQVKGGFGNRLKNSVRWDKKQFEIYNGRCAFLNDKNLCDLYIECGKDSLCETCRMFPRHIEEFENLREISLTLSCPEAARIILTNENRVDFVTTEDEKDEMYEDFDYFLYTALLDAREVIFRLVQDRGTNYRIRMAMALALAHDIQNRVKKGAIYEIDELLQRYEKPNAQVRFAKKLEPYCNRKKDAQKYMMDFLTAIENFEVLNPKWPKLLQKAKNILSKETEKLHIHGQQETALWWEQLMTYFVFIYFCGAVYDEEVLEKMKLSVVSTLIILELNKVYDDIVEVGHLFAKEMEHSDENLEIFEKELLQKPICSFERLLVCIMNL